MKISNIMSVIVWRGLLGSGGYYRMNRYVNDVLQSRRFTALSDVVWC